MTKTTYKDLDVWKLSIQLVKDIYQLTSKFPSEEKLGKGIATRRLLLASRHWQGSKQSATSSQQPVTSSQIPITRSH
jgi:hypothetical protein